MTPVPPSPFLTMAPPIAPIAEPILIYVRYFSVDGSTKIRKFKSLKGARKFAHSWVGEHPEIGVFGNYAVSGDGIGKVVVEGATLAELFPS